MKKEPNQRMESYKFAEAANLSLMRNVILEKFMKIRPKQILGILIFLPLYFLLRQFITFDFVNHESEFRLAKEKLTAATKEEDKYLCLDDAAFQGALSGHFDEAKVLAEELLHLADKYKKSNWQTMGWNYGNAIHKGHSALGLVALRMNDLNSARHHLLQSAPSDAGSPQMKSFGPNMTLARELLKKGERDVVLKYFDQCDRFWTVPVYWRWFVEMGLTPSFGANMDY